MQLIKSYKESNLIVRAGFWFLIITVADKGIAVLTQPIINRILSTDEVGILGVFSSWRSVFSILATFNLFGGILEVQLTKNPRKKNEIILSLCTLSLVISLIFWCVFFLLEKRIASYLGLNRKYLVIMAIMITSETIIQFWVVPRKFEYAYKPYGIMMISLLFCKAVLSVFLTIYIKSDRVAGRLMGLIIPSTFAAVIILLSLFIKRQGTRLTTYWKKGVIFNLPLIPHYLSSVLLASSDRIMIQKLSGKTEVGLYTVAYSFANLTLIVFNALNNTYNPLSMKAIRDKDYLSLRKSTEFLVLLSVVISAIVMLLAPEGIWLLGGDKYLSTVKIVPILIIGIYFSSFYFIFSNVEFVYETNRYIFPITLIGALVNIGLNYIFIPLIGYQVAAYTTAIGYALIAVMHYMMSKKIIGYDIYNIKKICLYIGVMFICGGIATVSYNCKRYVRYGIIALIVICVCIIAFMNFDKIHKLIISKTQ